MRRLMSLLLPMWTWAFVPNSPSGIPNFSSSRLHAIKDATFGMGCFWEPAEELLKVEGVVDTVAGYTGKTSATEAPNYDSVCFSRDWVEGVRVRYDDEKISYEELLDSFFASQKPKLGSRQYASIIFPHDEDQRQVATNYLQENANKQQADGWVTEWTAIEPLSKFFKAEGYHQNYWKKQRPRFAAIIALLAVATGVLDPIVPETFQKTVESIANASVLAIGIYQLLERVVDAKVEEL
mmetsp:Transcript_33898/g.97546  ORF Transcript_33898/g.97546 Transcript_33898/m.97546 type:complete len:238 (-) Transcript_33898:12-725(-)